jgi:hypothetical protein
MFIALAGLVSLLAWIVVRFSTPRPMQVLVGQVQDFQPGQAPHLFDQDSTLFYVLNVNGELVALYARSLRHTRCQVNWDERRDVFNDPCLGTRFTPTGDTRAAARPRSWSGCPCRLRMGRCGWRSISLKDDLS